MVEPKKYCYFNGKIIPFSQAKIRVDDLGVTRGFGVFDVSKSYGDGKVFLLDAHVNRFFHSAETIDLTPPMSKKTLTRLIQTLLKKNGGGEAQVRVVMTGGAPVDGLRFNKKKPTVFILIEPFIPFSHSVYRNGTKLITHEFQRAFPRAKTTNYITAVSLQEERIKAKAIEILFVSRGFVREASTSNIFILKGNNLITPYEGILLGITRDFTLKLAKPLYHVEERNIRTEELFSADEVFLTATNKEIVPIVTIDGKKIGDGKVGKNTKTLMRLFREKTGPSSISSL